MCYGAAAKGATLLNYCGVHADLIDYAVDRSPHKQGLFMPGSRLPIHDPARVAETKPDYLLILPYNLRDEIIGEMSHVRSWGGRFVVAIPELQIVEGSPLIAQRSNVRCPDAHVAYQHRLRLRRTRFRKKSSDSCTPNFRGLCSRCGEGGRSAAVASGAGCRGPV